MDWIWDHIILLAGLTALALLIVGAILVAVRARRLWKTARRSLATTNANVTMLTDALDAVSARGEALMARQGEIVAAQASLGTQLGVLAVVGRHLSRALRVLRGPLGYFGR